MLKGELDQIEELSVEDLTIDHELNVVLLHLVLQPVWNLLVNVAVADELDLLLCISCSASLWEDYLSQVFLELLLVYEHVGRLSPVAT